MAEPAHQLRPAHRQDANAIRKLIWRVRINPTGLDWHHFWIAVDSQDHLLGCGQLKPHADGSLELASIAVQPEHRNQGIATEIIRQLLALSPRPLYLRCAGNMPPFYQRFGFYTIPQQAMPLSFRRDYQMVTWLRNHLFPRLPGFYVMRLD